MKQRAFFASTSLLGLAGFCALTACTSPLGEQLSRTSPVTAGAACPQGGTLFQSGADRNHNGVLDDGEVDASTTVCNTNVPPTLTRVEPAGAHCASGGSAVESGPDTNGNGVLDDSEVTSTTYACAPDAVFHGDFTAAMWQDPTAVAALQQAQVVTGNLDLDGVATVSLPNLELVAGNVTANGTDLLALDLPALAHVGGNLELSDEQQLTGALALPALAHVDGNLTLDFYSSDGASMPALTDVGGALEVLNGTGGVALPALASIGGDLNCAAPEVTDLAVPALTEVRGQLTVNHTNQLATIEITKLARVENGVFIYDNAALTELHLWALVFTGGTIDIDDDPAMTLIMMPALTANERLSVYDMDKLRVLYVEALTRARQISITNDPALYGLALTHLTELSWDSTPDDGTLTVAGTAVAHLQLTRLVKATGTIGLANDPQLTTIDAPALTTIGGTLSVQTTGLADLRAFAGVTTLGALDVESNPALTALTGLEQVTSLPGALAVKNDPALASLAGLANLTKVGGAVDVSADAALTADQITAFLAQLAPPAAPAAP